MLRCALLVLALIGGSVLATREAVSVLATREAVSVLATREARQRQPRTSNTTSTSTDDPLRKFLTSYTIPDQPSSYFEAMTEDEIEASNKLVIFLHIPKTAGQLLHKYMGAALHGPKSACLKVGFEDECEASKNSTQSAPMTRFDLAFAASSKFKKWRALPKTLVTAAEPLRGFLGHFDMSVTDALGQFDMLFMTVLRRPRDRLLSWYSYLKSNSEDIEYCLEHPSEKKHKRSTGRSTGRCDGQIVSGFMRSRSSTTLESFRENQQANWNGLNKSLAFAQHRRSHRGLERGVTFGPKSLPSNVTFQEFVSKLRLLEVDNYVTRALAGAHAAATFYPEPRRENLSDEAMLALAKDMLRKFAFVGIVEEIGDTVRLLEFLSGQELNLKQKKFNTTPRKSNTTTREDDAIAEMEWMDNEIYALGLELFREQLEQMDGHGKANK